MEILGDRSTIAYSIVKAFANGSKMPKATPAALFNAMVGLLLRYLTR